MRGRGEERGDGESACAGLTGVTNEVTAVVNARALERPIGGDDTQRLGTGETLIPFHPTVESQHSVCVLSVIIFLPLSPLLPSGTKRREEDFWSVVCEESERVGPLDLPSLLCTPSNRAVRSVTFSSPCHSGTNRPCGVRWLANPRKNGESFGM